ncbi:MAG TPA: VanZ family protein [Pyrinomonadaceae bacterium]|jgi:hypothetical protein|nr:VanZ family protein [Pyrinomonadaceae bacterium]
MKRAGFWWRYGPLLLWMALIFVGSTNVLAASNTSGFAHTVFRGLFTRMGEEGILFWHFLVRKSGHFIEYAILAWLAVRAFRTSPHRPLLASHASLFAFLLVAVYSLFDEYHQSFVQTRGASVFDSLIDMAGGACAVLLIEWRRKRTFRKLAKQDKINAS